MSFDRYLASLVGSWAALAAPHPDARVVRGDGFVALRCDGRPVLSNAALLRPDALPRALEFFDGTGHYAVWSADAATAAAVAAAGLVRDTTTVPMVCELATHPPPPDVGSGEVGSGEVGSRDVHSGAVHSGAVHSGAVHSGVPLETVADIAGVDAGLLRGVPGLWTFASAGLESGLVLIPVGTDVNVGFVATRGSARRRGLAGRVLRHALAAARGCGFRTASLQSTPMAERVYTGAGFVPVGHWQEWVPAG